MQMWTPTAARLENGLRPARSRFVRRTIIVIACLTLTVLFGPAAEHTSRAEDTDDNGMERARFVRPDRSLMRLLDQAQPLIEQERYADAVSCLGEILESPVDYLIEPDASDTTHTTLKSQARRLLRSMPPTGRQLYQLSYGATARRLLKDAAAAQDPDALAAVVDRYFQTEAGIEAAMLLGLHLLDTGQYPTAAHMLGRVFDEAGAAQRFEPTLSLALAIAQHHSGASQTAAETLANLRRRIGEETVQVGGVELPLFAQGDDPLPWLERVAGPAAASYSAWLTQGQDWTMHRAVPWRNASNEASVPLLNIAWRIPTSDYPVVASLVEQLRTQARLFLPEPAIPSCHPLVVHETVLMRTLDRLLAVDLKTGKRLWEAAAEDPFEMLVGPATDTANTSPSRTMQRQQLAPALRIRAWGDTNFGTLSSDGRRVFSVEDLELAMVMNPYRTVIVQIPGGGQRVERLGPRSYNRLVAHDVRTGERLWAVGGPASGADAASDGDAAPGQAVLGGGNAILRQIGPNGARIQVFQAPGGAVPAIKVAAAALQKAEPAGADADADNEGAAEDSPEHEEQAEAEKDTAPTEADSKSAEDDPPCRGCFFLGPPLPLDGRLHVLAERAGQICLLVLAPEDGRLLWELPLVDADILINDDPIRRVGGVTPSASGGVLICPTSNHSVIAVDLATHAPLWGYTYATLEAARQPGVFRHYSKGVNPDPLGRWVDSSVVIHDERVLFTPVDSPELFCLRLADGSLLWKTARSDAPTTASPLSASQLLLNAPEAGQNDAALYVACAHEDNVILVTRRGVRALRIADGERAWEEDAVVFPPGAQPSGHGIRTGDLYHVPLSNGTIVSVDLRKGETTRTTRSRSGVIPGNLVCCRGHIVSQRADAVEAFYQIEWLRNATAERLARAPDDAEALALRGQIQWNDGLFDEAIESLDAALESGRTKTRRLLLSVYFDALESDFAKYLPRLDAIRRLVDSSEQEVALLRLLASGYESQEAWAAALDCYAQLMQQADLTKDLVEMDDTWSVRCARWIGVRLATLYRSAPPETQAMIETLTRQQLEAARSHDGTEAIARYVESFGRLPGAEAAFDDLLAAYAERGDLLRLETLLESRGSLADIDDSRLDALATLARAFIAEEDWDSAADCYRWIDRHFSEAETADGATGKSLVAAAMQHDKIKQRLRSESAWPIGEVKVTRTKLERPAQSVYGYYAQDFARPRGPFFQGLSFQSYPRQDMPLTAYDANGNELWSVPLRSANDISTTYYSSNLRVWPIGHLLLASSGAKTVAVDTRRIGPDGQPTVLWRRDAASDVTVGIHPALAGGMMSRVYYNGRIIGQDSAILLPDAACYLDYGKLLAVDPITGEKIWSREGVTPGSAIVGDDEYLFLIEPTRMGISIGRVGKLPARVFQTIDGAEVGRREVPYPRLATVGRNVLTLEHGMLDATFSLIDPWIEDEEERVVWKIEDLPQSSRYATVDNELLAIVTPKGTFSVYRLADGEKIAEQKLPFPKSAGRVRGIVEIHFWRSSDGYVLVATSDMSIQQDGKSRIYQLSGTSPPPRPIGQGFLMAFDRACRPLWDEMVLLRNTSLPLNQPAGAPMLLFGARIQTPPDEKGRVQQSMWLMGVDRRTGRVVMDEVIDSYSSRIGITADPARDRMKIQLQLGTIDLQFTGEEPKPLSHTKYFTNQKGERPGTTAKDAAASDADKAESDRPLGEALLGALGRAIARHGTSSRTNRLDRAAEEVVEEAAEELIERAIEINRAGTQIKEAIDEDRRPGPAARPAEEEEEAPAARPAARRVAPAGLDPSAAPARRTARPDDQLLPGDAS